jgi:hypothetical protein
MKRLLSNKQHALKTARRRRRNKQAVNAIPRLIKTEFTPLTAFSLDVDEAFKLKDKPLFGNVFTKEAALTELVEPLQAEPTNQIEATLELRKLRDEDGR